MTPYKLIAPHEAVDVLAAFSASIPGDAVSLSVREDKCFAQDKSLSMGTISIKNSSEEFSDDSVETPYHNAIKNGFYEWHTPHYNSLIDETNQLLGLPQKTNSKNQTQKTKAEFALRLIMAAATRIGLLHPRLDAAAMSQIPFLRPTTVVADTSAILGGGLNFVVRFLYPMARIKVPAIVHMEILNTSDNYFKHRRRPEGQIKKGEALYAHMLSQGGQRVLLHLELQTDAEIERTSIFSDPLRNAFQADKESDARDLNISAPIRSYCDRLILESTRQHQSQTSPGHPVLLMTSDQGLARMALAEGIQPLYFDVHKPDNFFGKILTGTNFGPFDGAIYGVSLVDLLWELAVNFGSAKLMSQDGDKILEVAAIGEDLSWQPFHSKDDLLWLRSDGFTYPMTEEKPTEAATEIKPRTSVLQVAAELEPSRGESTTIKDKKVVQRAARPMALLKGSYKFSIGSLVKLLESLVQKDGVHEVDAQKIVAVNKAKDFSDYRNFLLSGNFISYEAGYIIKTPKLEKLWKALRERDLNSLGQCLMAVSSFREFIKFLNEHRPTSDDQPLPISKRSLSTYRTLAELAALLVYIPEEGYYSTPNNPRPKEFAAKALDCYNGLARGERFVLTGLWLEALARDHGIHPLNARDRLAEARTTRHLERYTEGATPETRFEKHSFKILDLVEGLPMIRTIYLYHGDFLIPGKASVSLRLEEPPS